MIKHIQNDQDNLAIPKTKQISPEDSGRFPRHVGKNGTLSQFSINAKLRANRPAALA